MKKQIAILLALLLLGGCSAGSESSAGESAVLLAGETVSGIITQVNGNEITLDLVTLNRAAAARGGEEAGEPEEGEEPSQVPEKGAREEGQFPGGSREVREAPSGGENLAGRPQGGGPGEDSSGEGPRGSLPAGEGPSFGGSGSGQEKAYRRTGETALYQIPVGAAVVTLTGTSRGFNSLSAGLLVTITFREDGVTPGQVQVIQSLS